jgi:hypothetical protein
VVVVAFQKDEPRTPHSGVGIQLDGLARARPCLETDLSQNFRCGNL